MELRQRIETAIFDVSFTEFAGLIFSQSNKFSKFKYFNYLKQFSLIVKFIS